MDEAKLSAFIAEYDDYITILIGLVLIAGSVKNWDWLCDPTGKPDAQLLSRSMYRLIFGALGLILIVCSF